MKSDGFTLRNVVFGAVLGKVSFVLFGWYGTEGLIPTFWQAIGIFVIAWTYVLWPRTR